MNAIVQQFVDFVTGANAPKNDKAAVQKAVVDAFLHSPYYAELLDDLNQRINVRREAIFAASRIDNVNIRGRLIEHIITNAYDEHLVEELQRLEENEPSLTHNDLGDYHRIFSIGDEVVTFDSYTDIKTKIVYLDSNPKAYNIDKFLSCMAAEKSVFLFFFVGIDNADIQATKLCSVYDKKVVGATFCQFHWAGRNSRGVTQFNGKEINVILKADYQVEIDKATAQKFLQDLLER